MCGIAGLIDFRCQSNLEITEAMNDALAHRGPDDRGTYFEERGRSQVGLANRRLAIIDLSDQGHQPQISEDGDYVLVFNGEIYNYREIRRRLTGLGHTFRSQSDTEVVLKSFIQWGPSGVHHFIGMFAFAVYHRSAGKVYLFRDRAGVKPLYYYHRDGLFLFSSELKSFHQHPRFTRDIDRTSLAMYFQYGYIPSPYSIFIGGAKVKPGHYMVVDVERETATDERYWDLEHYLRLPPLDIGEEEAMDRLEDLLLSAFEYRMVADVPVGVFLSGGYDSSGVAALLSRKGGWNLKTFTIGFTENQYDESSYARGVAAHLGTDHTEYICSSREGLDLLPQVPDILDEPMADNSILPTYLVAKLAREKVKVALSADGGDEIFGGYNSYRYALNMWRFLRHLPRPLTRTAGRLMELVSPRRLSFLPPFRRFETRYLKVAQILRHPRDLPRYLAAIDSQTPEWEVKQLFSSVPILPPTVYTNPRSPHLHKPLHRLLAADYQGYMCDDILVKVDRATMAVSLEGRDPLLDHRIIEFTSRLPQPFVYQKYLFKKIVHRYLPRSLMERPKMGFATPMENWLKTDLWPQVEEYLSPSRLKREGFFDIGEVEHLKQQFRKGKGEYHNTLWCLLLFELWYDRWIA